MFEVILRVRKGLSVITKLIIQFVRFLRRLLDNVFNHALRTLARNRQPLRHFRGPAEELSINDKDVEAWNQERRKIRGYVKLPSPAYIDAIFTNKDLSHVTCTDVLFRRCDFSNCKLSWSDLSGASLYECNFSNVEIHGVYLIGTKGLYGGNGVQHSDTVHNAHTAIYGHSFDLATWSALRSIGTVPLFGISYFGILLLWATAVSVNTGNTFIKSAQATAEREVAKLADSAEKLASKVHLESVEVNLSWIAEMVRRLPHFDNPPQARLTLMALLFLAAAATCYKVFCPQEIQESSEVRWVHELGQPLVAYRSMKYCNPILRQVTTICYLIGAPWVLYLFACRVYDAMLLLK